MSILGSSINTIKARISTRRKYCESRINFLANFKGKVVATKCSNKSESKLLKRHEHRKISPTCAKLNGVAKNKQQCFSLHLPKTSFEYLLNWNHANHSKQLKNIMLN